MLPTPQNRRRDDGVLEVRAGPVHTIPSYATSGCSSDPSRYSSACSCVVTASATTTFTTTVTTTTSTTTKPGVTASTTTTIAGTFLFCSDAVISYYGNCPAPLAPHDANLSPSAKRVMMSSLRPRGQLRYPLPRRQLPTTARYHHGHV